MNITHSGVFIYEFTILRNFIYNFCSFLVNIVIVATVVVMMMMRMMMIVTLLE